MPKRGFWNDRNHYQAQDVRYHYVGRVLYRSVRYLDADGIPALQGVAVGARSFTGKLRMLPWLGRK